MSDASIIPSGIVQLREVRDADLPIFFLQQQNETANRQAAFTRKDPTDQNAFMAHWKKIRGDDSVLLRTILVDDQVGGSVASYVAPDLAEPEVTYWLGADYWGQGVATKALRLFLELQTHRPIYGRAAFDNGASLRVLEKCGFQVVGRETCFANARGCEVEEVILRLDT